MSTVSDDWRQLKEKMEAACAAVIEKYPNRQSGIETQYAFFAREPSPKTQRQFQLRKLDSDELLGYLKLVESGEKCDAQRRQTGM